MTTQPPVIQHQNLTTDTQQQAHKEAQEQKHRVNHVANLLSIPPLELFLHYELGPLRDL